MLSNVDGQTNILDISFKTSLLCCIRSDKSQINAFMADGSGYSLKFWYVAGK